MGQSEIFFIDFSLILIATYCTGFTLYDSLVTERIKPSIVSLIAIHQNIDQEMGFHQGIPDDSIIDIKK